MEAFLVILISMEAGDKVVGGCDIGFTTGKAVVMIDGGSLMNFGKYE